jgi:hypothetical protein
VRIALYADDHIMVIDEKEHPEWKSFEVRSRLYKELGCTLAPDKDFVSNTLEGHTFLGLTAKWSTRFMKYVPHFDVNKAYNSLAKYEKRYGIDQVYDRAYTLLHLVCFDDLAFKNIQGFLFYLKTQYSSLLPGRVVPNRTQCYAYWLGHESAAGGDKKADGPNEKEITRAIEGWTTYVEAVRCETFGPFREESPEESS